MYTGKINIQPKTKFSADVVSRYQQRNSDKNLTLAERIDYEWSVFIHPDCNSMQKNLAQDFLVYAFDIREKDNNEIKERLETLMHARNAWKTVNPDYVPGKNPSYLGLTPLELVISKTDKYNLASENRHKQLLSSKELLDVYDQYKHIDNELGTTFLSSSERNRYRVVVCEGLFKKHRKNFDTTNYITHERKGFASCVLTANGELLIFNHLAGERTAKKKLLLYHSSMNGGAPVIFAGEIQILNGSLQFITPYSGHYKPSLWNVYRLLQYFSGQDVDLSKVEILTTQNPSKHIDGISTKEIHKIKGFSYSTSAKALYDSITLSPEKILELTFAKLVDYEGSNFWFYTIDFFMNTDLTAERTKLAQEFYDCLLNFEKTVTKVTTVFQLNPAIDLLETQLQIIEQKNNALSQKEGKETNSGRLSEHIGFFRKNMQDVKKGTPIEQAQALKKLF